MSDVVIEVVEYDEAWPACAARAMIELEALLPEVFTVIEHIGSTSVPGLAAKPVIDLMAAVVDLSAVLDREAALSGAGYQRLDTGMSGRLFYRRVRDGRPTHHLHVVPAGTFATRNERLLRDHLRANPADADRYGALKRELANQSTRREAYTRAKTALIQELIDRARVDRGLPPVPVWED